MNKARQARFNAEILDGEFRGAFYGTEDDLALCVEQGAEYLFERHPSMRKKFRRATRAAMWATAPEWLRQFVKDLPWGITGATLLFWAVYGVTALCHALCHWIGVV